MPYRGRGRPVGPGTRPPNTRPARSPPARRNPTPPGPPSIHNQRSHHPPTRRDPARGSRPPGPRPRPAPSPAPGMLEPGPLAGQRADTQQLHTSPPPGPSTPSPGCRCALGRRAGRRPGAPLGPARPGGGRGLAAQGRTAAWGRPRGVRGAARQRTRRARSPRRAWRAGRRCRHARRPPRPAAAVGPLPLRRWCPQQGRGCPQQGRRPCPQQHHPALAHETRPSWRPPTPHPLAPLSPTRFRTSAARTRGMRSTATRCPS
jgi:hypothetical protein